ncbi:MAG: hypothetical protein QW562_07360 [Thermosphaera sp.]
MYSLILETAYKYSMRSDTWMHLDERLRAIMRLEMATLPEELKMYVGVWGVSERP